MKVILKAFIFSYLSLFATQQIIGGFVFEGDKNITVFLVILALALLNVFIMPVLGVLSLPHKGPGALFLSFILNLIVMYMLTVFLPTFYVHDANVSELIIFGVVLPSKSLTKFWALIFSSLLFVVILNFFKWICSNK